MNADHQAWPLLEGVEFTAGNRVSVLVDGPDTHAAMLDAIGGARDHVHIETYTLEDSDIGGQLRDALVAKSKQGVCVRLLFDAVGSFDASDSFVDSLRHGGVDARRFRPLNPLSEAAETPVDERNHRKLLIVDGRVAFTGGVNFSDGYSTSPLKSDATDFESGTPPWRDTHLSIDGPIVNKLQETFLDLWRRSGGSAEEADWRFYPELGAAGEDFVRIALSEKTERSKLSIRETYLRALLNAQRHAWITQAYFAPDNALIDVIRRTAKRGVDVRLILPHDSDSNLLIAAARSHYEELLDAGVRIFERKHALLHAKTAVVDGYWSTVGSSNLDSRSLVFNLELNAVVISPSVASRLEALFERDQEESVEITAESWNSRSVTQRASEKLAGLIEDWL